MAIAIPTRKKATKDPTDQIVEWCWVKDMFVDARFQRPLHEPTVKKIVAGFDIDQLGLPFVNIREGGKLSVIDGSHRVAAVRDVVKVSPLRIVKVGLFRLETRGEFRGKFDELKILNAVVRHAELHSPPAAPGRHPSEVARDPSLPR
jgi:hypothetical protein